MRPSFSLTKRKGEDDNENLKTITVERRKEEGEEERKKREEKQRREIVVDYGRILQRRYKGKESGYLCFNCPKNKKKK